MTSGLPSGPGGMWTRTQPVAPSPAAGPNAMQSLPLSQTANQSRKVLVSDAIATDGAADAAPGAPDSPLSPFACPASGPHEASAITQVRRADFKVRLGVMCIMGTSSDPFAG